MEYLNLFVRSIFIENMIFAYFLGMCSYLAVSKTVNTAVGLGAAVIFVLTVTVPINFLLDQYLLSPGALSWLNPEYANVDLSFLSFIMFIAVIASMVQLVEMIVEKFAPELTSRSFSPFTLILTGPEGINFALAPRRIETKRRIKIKNTTILAIITVIVVVFLL